MAPRVGKGQTAHGSSAMGATAASGYHPRMAAKVCGGLNVVSAPSISHRRCGASVPTAGSGAAAGAGCGVRSPVAGALPAVLLFSTGDAGDTGDTQCLCGFAPSPLTGDVPGTLGTRTDAK